MDIEEFKKYGYEIIDWIADYYSDIEKYPVKSKLEPGEIINKLPNNPPEKQEPIYKIIDDFTNTILPGITHWQHPNWHGYFPANSSYPSVLAEFLTAALGVQGMIWETSPAATELEIQVMDWLKQMTGLPKNWHGVIQDTASTATLVSLLTAREKFSGFNINEQGYKNHLNYRIYCSTEAHSSIVKAVKIAGFGHENLIKIEVDEDLKINPEKLEEKIKTDIKKGFQPLCIIAALGTTGTTAVDNLAEISRITKEHKLWLHVDAAYSGTALVLPEYRWMIRGIENVDSFVFNPHKWMFTNFDCSAYFVKDKEALINTFSILPEYLRTQTSGKVTDYRELDLPYSHLQICLFGELPLEEDSEL